MKSGVYWIFFSLMIALSPSAQAWSEFVHSEICEQAYQRLSPQAKQMVLKLTTGEHQLEGDSSFGHACVWADEVRHTSHKATYEYHFINTPRDADINLARDCAAHDCVNQAVKRYAIYLSDQNRRPSQRAEALRFLGHFVADLHQPLHVGNKEDRGGNDIHVFWLQESETQRLHGLWDGTIPRAMDLLEAVKFTQIVDELSDEQIKVWSTIDIDSWAHESFELARSVVYRSTQNENLKNGDHLQEAYFERAQPVVKQRIQQSIVRLAALLELAANHAINQL